MFASKMAAELGLPPYSLHSVSSVDEDEMELSAYDDDTKKTNQEVFVLREKKGVIYSLDYKYRVGEFDKISVDYFKVNASLSFTA